MKLNWGCGPDMRAGWVNSDVLRYPAIIDGGTLVTQDHVGAIDAGLPWGDETFDYIVSHHVLQMIAWSELVPALVELRRVLKPDGWLRISVPSIVRAMKALREDDASWFPISDAHETSVDGKFCMYVTQAGASRSVFTYDWLAELLTRAGFSRIVAQRIFETHTAIADITSVDSRGNESIFVDVAR